MKIISIETQDEFFTVGKKNSWDGHYVVESIETFLLENSKSWFFVQASNEEEKITIMVNPEFVIAVKCERTEEFRGKW